MNSFNLGAFKDEVMLQNHHPSGSEIWKVLNHCHVEKTCFIFKLVICGRDSRSEVLLVSLRYVCTREYNIRYLDNSHNIRY